MTVAAPPNPMQVAADIIDPPQWEPVGRGPLGDHQRPPAGTTPGPDNDWTLWLFEGGRGAGKTEACARYFAAWMHMHPGHRGRIIAPTLDDAVESCVNGPSGLLAVDPSCRMVTRPGGTFVLWPNGSRARLLGTHTPREVNRLRAGGNVHIDWWEEMAANTQLEDAWDQAALGLRLGDQPHSVASTTPKPTKAYKAIRSMDETVLTHGTMDDNPGLTKAWKAARHKRYAGTRIGRQELQGELLEDVEGALWTLAQIEHGRVRPEAVPDLHLVAVSVDPAATSSANADDTGIIVGGLGMDGDVYVWADRTCHVAPKVWGRRAVQALEDYEGDYIVGEINNGGEMVETVIRSVEGGEDVQYVAVRASRGKATRAQPVSALYGDPDPDEGYEPVASRVHHVLAEDGSNPLEQLEEQQTTWVPGEDDSPDRLDALVWLVTDLAIADDDAEEIVEDYEPVKIGADI